MDKTPEALKKVQAVVLKMLNEGDVEKETTHHLVPKEYRDYTLPKPHTRS